MAGALPEWLEPMAATLTEKRFNDPEWLFERKYDGIRLLLHKQTDAHGSVLCGAYTRNRGDWLELIPGLSGSIQCLPASCCTVRRSWSSPPNDMPSCRILPVSI